MFIHTDLLRAALCCVADSTEERRYLQGIHITSTHIQACNKIACVSMEHGDKKPFEGVFIVIGTIPPGGRRYIHQPCQRDGGSHARYRR